MASAVSDDAPRALSRSRYLWWRLVKRHVAGWLDRRWEARHPFPIKLGCGPWSYPESRWHECVGHEWERIVWPYGRAVLRGSLPDRITRCRKCGAPRCNSYYGPGAMSDLTENEQEGQRCTFERHHADAHDYLDGPRIEVGA